MKKIKYNILRNVAALLMVAIAASSCSSFLEEDPHSVKTDKWTSQADAESGVNKLYDSGLPTLYGDRNNGWHPTRLMYGGLLSGLFKDDKKNGEITGNIETLNITYQTVSDDITHLYRIAYEGIGRCNLAIANLPKMVDQKIITEDKKNELIAQAYFFRALSYFFLLKEFGCKDGEAKDGGNGGVPLVLELYADHDPNTVNVPRSPIGEVYGQIVADLTEALKGDALPNKTFYSNGSRITRPAAQALLTAVYLQWAGYPVQNTAMYEKAAQTAEEIITGGSGHDLENSTDTYLNSAFNIIKNSKTNKEVIYAVEYNQPLSKNNPYINSCMTGQATNWIKTDGSKVFSTNVLDNMYHVSNPVIESYVAGDVRGMEKNFFFKEYTASDGSIHDCKQYDNWFWFDDASMVNGLASSLDFPVFRMSDIYLMAAEALLKQTAPNEPKARGYLELVKKRAFTVNGTINAGYSLPATITIDDILTERLHEFPLEFKVWDDIRRNRLYPQAQADKSLKWVDISVAETYGKDDGRSFKNNQHMLLWPIPQKAIERNPKLGQNPGY